ncbi:MAG TPA: GH3 auxin-responsive promoter family protein, partial [Caulifigura sp.]|nr:GH3 auxin-responsive promoter family protein [Caulifigura sp.]
TQSAPGEIPLAIRSALRPRRNPARAKELDAAAQRDGRLTLHAAWPDMQLLAVWTAGSAAAYLPKLRGQFPGVTIRDHGLSASEARMSITLSEETRSAPLDVASHFFEFIPEDEIDSPQPTVLMAHELEVDRNYFILLTTSCGLYRYDIRDVVRVNGFEGTTPCVEFLHKGAHISNLTGEKITESQAVAAVTAACRELRLSLSAFTLTPVWGDPPRYHLLVEAGEVPASLLARAARTIDEQLAALNCEYDEKRKTSRLLAVTVTELPAGAWAALVRDRQSRPSGSLEQYKHPCLAPDMAFLDRLRALIGNSALRRAA